LFFVFIALTFSASLYLLLRHWDELKTDAHMSSMFSREALFLLNNLLFIGILVVCFWGVIYPLISELATGQKVTVGPPYYERATGPLFAGLLLLMGVAPLSAWGHASLKTMRRNIIAPFLFSLLGIVLPLISGIRNPWAILGFWLSALAAAIIFYEFFRGAKARSRRSGDNFLVELWRLAGRNRRRYGGYIIHLGVVLMAIGIIGIEIFQTETQGTIASGEALTLGDYNVRYESLADFNTDDGRNVARAVVSVEKNGQHIGQLYPRRDFYFEAQQPMTIPGVRSTWEDDLYVILVDWMPISSQGATFKVYNNPLVNWLWLGGFVFIIGTMVAAWPDKDPERSPKRTGRKAIAGARA
jgi:cytochrome c-type biogenesis protein CcmF